MMSADQMLIEKLRTDVQGKKLVVVVGSGVSCATTRKALSWQALIASGAERCQSLKPATSWFSIVQSQLDPADKDQLSAEDRNDMLIQAAESVEQKLKRFGDGEFSEWLRDTFEHLEAEEPSLIKAIVDLDLPIVTTNYDDLITKASDLKFLTWQEERKASRFLLGDDRRVLHLHGHWDEPESIILGIRSYEVVRHNEHTQTVMKSLATTKNLLFIGCGDDGLNDPNFGNFMSWLKAFDNHAERRHYRLVRNADKRDPQGRLFCVGYGDDYEELPDFVKQLRPTVAVPVPAPVRGGNDASARTKIPDSVAHYLARLKEDTSRLQLLRMGSDIQIDLPISDAYVPLKTCPTRHMEKTEPGRYSEDHVAGDVSVELAEVFRLANDYHVRGVVLLGEPGAGKTTGARQLAWQLSSGQRLAKDLGLPVNSIPVLLRFKNFSSQSINDDIGLRGFLEQQTACKAAPDGLNSPGVDLWNGRGGPLLWILDGLDEIIDPMHRQKVSGWIQEAICDRPNDYFLVTCRYAGYFKPGVPLGDGFVQFHVRPLEPVQIRQFVNSWYSTAYRKLGQSADAQTRSEALLTMLEQPAYQTQRIRELSSNPLMLTILCIVYHKNQKLPRDRFHLYKQCVEVLLEHWRHGATEFDSMSAQSVLARVAWWMHSEQNRTAAPLNSLSKQASLGLKGIKEDDGLGQDGATFLNRMKDETGILASEQNGRIGFLHLSFQEFLAASYAASCRKSKLLAERAADSWWQEVALLSLRHSKQFNNSFFRELINSGVAEQHPSVAESCMSESRWLPLKAFNDVLKNGENVRNIVAVLRLLRNRVSEFPGIAELVLPLAKSPDSTVNALVGEILTQLGITAEVPKMRGNVMFHLPGNIALVRITAGKFEMGSMSGRDNEQPVHMVQISRDFLLGRYPVTNAQYGEYLKAAGNNVRKPDYWDDRRFNQPEQPVVGVSWNDAQEFCEWAGCRLPTETEWEYACRAGTTTAFSFGDKLELLDQHGWYDKNSGGQTQPVGSREPNAWGLYDMHGNVWEWCEDRYGEYDKKSVVDPSGPATGEGRVLRGGTWVLHAGDCRSSFRFNYLPEYRLDSIGFRVARTL